MKPNYAMQTLFIAVFALPLSAIADDKDASIVMVSTEGVIDDVVVIGKRSLGEMRREVYAAEEEFYSLFNRLNDENEYDVRCFYEQPTGTHIKNHVCRARFVTKAYSTHAARNRNDLSRVANQGSNPVIAEKTAKYQKKMETLIDANPELQAALIRYNTSRAQFLAVREERANN